MMIKMLLKESRASRWKEFIFSSISYIKFLSILVSKNTHEKFLELWKFGWIQDHSFNLVVVFIKNRVPSMRILMFQVSLFIWARFYEFMLHRLNVTPIRVYHSLILTILDKFKGFSCRTFSG